MHMKKAKMEVISMPRDEEIGPSWDLIECWSFEVYLQNTTWQFFCCTNSTEGKRK